tara:strand:+ start:479 stop:1078 length:600 start_codon:yes stop_codon:yes gene_type:complete
MAYKQKGWCPFTKLEDKEREMKKLKGKYASLDTSNPYSNMQNMMEDLTVSQKQYNLDRERFQQSQSNALSSLKESSGSSGAANVAQAMSLEGKKVSQKSSADIGKQERENQLLERKEAARLQRKKRKGEVLSRKMKKDKTSDLLAMSQQEVAAEKEKKNTAKTQKWKTISSGVDTVGSVMTKRKSRKIYSKKIKTKFKK